MISGWKKKLSKITFELSINFTKFSGKTSIQLENKSKKEEETQCRKLSYKNQIKVAPKVEKVTRDRTEGRPKPQPGPQLKVLAGVQGNQKLFLPFCQLILVWMNFQGRSTLCTTLVTHTHIYFTEFSLFSILYFISMIFLFFT